MKECRFQLTYIADGQLHRTCGKAQAQQPFATEYFSLMTQLFLLQQASIETVELVLLGRFLR